MEPSRSQKPHPQQITPAPPRFLNSSKHPRKEWGSVQTLAGYCLDGDTRCSKKKLKIRISLAQKLSTLYTKGQKARRLRPSLRVMSLVGQLAHASSAINQIARHHSQRPHRTFPLRQLCRPNAWRLHTDQRPRCGGVVWRIHRCSSAPDALVSAVDKIRELAPRLQRAPWMKSKRTFPTFILQMRYPPL